MDESQVIIQEQLAILPENVSGLLFSLDLRPHIHTIAQLRNLEEDQTTRLENEVVMVLIGLSNPLELAQQLASGEGALDIGRAQLVANDIYKEVFSSVETTLQEMYREEETAEQTATPEQRIPTFSNELKNDQSKAVYGINEEAIVTPAPVSPVNPSSDTNEPSRAVDTLNILPQITQTPKSPSQTPASSDPYRELIS